MPDPTPQPSPPPPSERRLLDRAEEFDLWLENVTDYALILIDPQGRVAGWNAGAERVFGHAESEITGRPADVLFTPEDVARGVPAAELRTAAERGRAGDDRWQKRRDGTHFWAYGVTTSLRDDSGALRGFAKIVRDQTGEKRHEERLTEALAYADAIIDTVREAVVVLCPALTVRRANRSFYQTFGVRPEETEGRPLNQLGSGQWDAPRLDALLKELFGGGESFEGVEIDAEFPRVGRRAFLLNARKLYRVGNNTHTAVLAFEEVTERRRRDRAEREKSEAMALASRRKDEFLAVLGHELRNPLATIQNAATILRRLGDDAAARERAVDAVERQVRFMRRLTDDTLDLARVVTGRLRLEKRRADVRRAAEEGVELARSLVESRQHGLTVELPGAPVWADLDPARFSQVVVNLLANAAKYTEVGGRIGVSLAAEGGEAVLRVRDTGVGISAEALPHVFDLFHQEGRSLGHSQGGLGVGLSLVRGLVERHGGSAVAASGGAGMGSEFTVRVPLLPGDEPAPPPSAIAALPAAPGRVLIVDDNVDSADSLAALLRLLGSEAQCVHTGEAALAAVHEFRPDAVVSDIGLPRMNGRELATRLRADPALAGVRLVAVSGFGHGQDVEKSRAAGFDDHLIKPVDFDRLLRALAPG